MFSAQVRQGIARSAPCLRPTEHVGPQLIKSSVRHISHPAKQRQQPWQPFVLPRQILSRGFDFLYRRPVTKQGKQVQFISRRPWSSWGSGGHDQLPCEDQEAYLTPANGNLMDGFKSALQAHEDSGEKLFTEEELEEIARLISNCKKDHTHLVANLRVGSSGYLGWRRTVGVYQKFVRLGVFHISKDHLAALQRIEKEADQSAITGRLHNGRQRFNAMRARKKWFGIICCTTLFIVVERLLSIIFYGNRDTEKGLGGEPTDIWKSTDDNEQADQC